jgi:predicted MFS family arabinose efflux permease
MLALEAALSTIRSMNPTAGQSLLHDLVPEEELMSAVALYSLGFNSARIVGPSLGGILMLWISVGGCLVFYGVTLLVSAIALLFIHLPKIPQPAAGSNWLGEIKEAFGYIGNAPVVLSSTLAAYVLSVFVGTYQRFLPVFAKDILKAGPDGLGALMAASGVGAVLSLVFLESVSRRWSRETLLWVTAKAAPLLLICFCYSRNLWLSVFMLALLGATQITFRTVSRLVIQVETPRELLGRVMSVFLMDQGMRSVGAMIMGSFVTLFGAAAGLSLCSLISIALTGVTFGRFLRRPAPPSR